MKPAPLADPGGTPRIPYSGDARREHPIVDEQPLGPWAGRVMVTPLTGIGPRAKFEVLVEWEGPPPSWAPPHPPVAQRRDTRVYDYGIEARAIAGAAIDLLRHGEVPELDVLEHALAERR